MLKCCLCFISFLNKFLTMFMLLEIYGDNDVDFDQKYPTFFKLHVSNAKINIVSMTLILLTYVNIVSIYNVCQYY